MTTLKGENGKQITESKSWSTTLPTDLGYFLLRAAHVVVAAAVVVVLAIAELDGSVQSSPKFSKTND